MDVPYPASGARIAASHEAIAAAERYFRNLQYQRHNYRRQEHLASLGLDLCGKSVLEVGAGVGDHTTFFLDRGCNVLSLEPRPENCRILADMMNILAANGYPHAARSRLVLGDAESLASLVHEKFDIVYCYGLLYHLAEPGPALRAMAETCLDLLLLESCVSFGEGEAVNPHPEKGLEPTQAVRGLGCRPTRAWMFNRLRELFGHVYVPRTQPAHEEFPLDWTAPPKSDFTRAVFVASRRALQNPMLLDYLPDRQTLL